MITCNIHCYTEGCVSDNNAIITSFHFIAMFSNTIKGIKADFKPMYTTARSAGNAWLDTSRKYVSQKMHQAAEVLDVHPAR